MKKSSTFLQAAGYFLFRVVRGSVYAATLTISLILPKLVLAQQTDIPRGMIMFGDAKAVYGQMRDSLGINWAQGCSERGRGWKSSVTLSGLMNVCVSLYKAGFIRRRS